MESKATSAAIKKWESIPQELVRLGMAKLIVNINKQGNGVFPGMEGKNLVSARVYQIFIGKGSLVDLQKVRWRFHYDERPGAKSSFKIDDRGLFLILNSMTLTNVFMKMTGINTSDPDKLLPVMEEALTLLKETKGKEKEAQPVKEIQKEVQRAKA